jgi:hypothetical protein
MDQGSAGHHVLTEDLHNEKVSWENGHLDEKEARQGPQLCYSTELAGCSLSAHAIVLGAGGTQDTWTRGVERSGIEVGMALTLKEAMSTAIFFHPAV